MLNMVCRGCLLFISQGDSATQLVFLKGLLKGILVDNLLPVPFQFGHPLRNNGCIAAGAIIDEDAGFKAALNRLPHEMGRLPRHLQLKHFFHGFVNGCAPA